MFGVVEDSVIDPNNATEVMENQSEKIESEEQQAPELNLFDIVDFH